MVPCARTRTNKMHTRAEPAAPATVSENDEALDAGGLLKVAVESGAPQRDLHGDSVRLHHCSSRSLLASAVDTWEKSE